MPTGYVELHAASFYSFGKGASHVHELLARAADHGCRALALTDSNLCGALEFARLAASVGIQPITGGELTLSDGSRIVLLARTRQGYANISRLLTLANAADRRDPRLDPVHLPGHAGGVVLLAGGRCGRLAGLALDGRRGEAADLLGSYMEWFGPGSVYVELQRNFLRGDTPRNHSLAALADEAGVPVVATNDVHYHAPERYRLQHALAASRRNTTIDQALPFILPNRHLHMKSPAQMQQLFRDRPDAIANTLDVAERCSFDLATDLGYTLPEPDLPDGFTAEAYLRRLCAEAAVRRYGSMSPRLQERLEEEFRLIRRHGLAGFLLLYREIVLLAQRIMEERGLADPETPLEERPPGRGRGSSVALLSGYLIGISHVDPIRWNLTLERFISEDMGMLPDIDLDFPRALRDELITPGARALRAGVRRPRRGRLHVLGQGHHPGPRQGPRPAQRGPAEPVAADPIPRRRPAGSGDAGTARLPRPGGRTGVAGPCRARPAAHGRPKGAGPARRRHGPERLAHPGHGPDPRRGHRGQVHHGLEQGQRGRRRLCEDRPALPARPGPDRGGAGPGRGQGGKAAGPDEGGTR